MNNDNSNSKRNDVVAHLHLREEETRRQKAVDTEKDPSVLRFDVEEDSPLGEHPKFLNLKRLQDMSYSSEPSQRFQRLQEMSYNSPSSQEAMRWQEMSDTYCRRKEQEAVENRALRLKEEENSLSSLKISKPSDPAEIEADIIAEEVMKATPVKDKDTIVSGNSVNNDEVKSSPGHERGNTGDIQESIESRINSLSGGQSLSRTEKEFFEPRFGADFSNVKVHTDSSAAETASAINARAYNKGEHIVFASGEYQPSTDDGKRLMAHELAHVVQGGKAGIFTRLKEKINRDPHTDKRREPSVDESMEKEFSNDLFQHHVKGKCNILYAIKADNRTSDNPGGMAAASSGARLFEKGITLNEIMDFLGEVKKEKNYEGFDEEIFREVIQDFVNLTASAKSLTDGVYIYKSSADGRFKIRIQIPEGEADPSYTGNYDPELTTPDMLSGQVMNNRLQAVEKYYEFVPLELLTGSREKGFAAFWKKASGYVHTGLDIAGFVPGLNIAAGAINTAIYSAEGDYVAAAIAAVAMVPFGKWVSAGGKVAVKGGAEALEYVARNAVAEGIEKYAKGSGKRVTREVAEKITVEVDEKLFKEFAGTETVKGIEHFIEQDVENLLKGHKELLKDGVLREQMASILKEGNGVVRAVQLGKIIENSGSVKRVMDYISKAKGIPGWEKVVQDLALGGNKYTGAEWVLRYIDNHGLWKGVEKFEIPVAGGERIIDALIDDVHYEFKSWYNFNKQTFIHQIKKDVSSIANGKMKWVFDSKANFAGSKEELVQYLKKVIEEAVKEKKIDIRTAQILNDNLESIIIFSK